MKLNSITKRLYNLVQIIFLLTVVSFIRHNKCKDDFFKLFNLYADKVRGLAALIGVLTQTPRTPLLIQVTELDLCTRFVPLPITNIKLRLQFKPENTNPDPNEGMHAVL